MPYLSPSFLTLIVVWFDPTSLAKAGRIVEAGVLGKVTYLKPNEGEALLLSKLIDPSLSLKPNCTLFLLPRSSRFLNLFCSEVTLDEAGEVLGKLVPTVIITKGANGVTLIQKGRERVDFAALKATAILNVPTLPLWTYVYLFRRLPICPNYPPLHDPPLLYISLLRSNIGNRSRRCLQRGRHLLIAKVGECGQCHSTRPRGCEAHDREC